MKAPPPDTLAGRVSKVWFSNYDEALDLEVRCAACGDWTPVRAPWAALGEGSGGLDLAPAAASIPFVLVRHLRTACRCGAGLHLVLSGGAGGRHGEEQYGVAGLASGGRVFR